MNSRIFLSRITLFGAIAASVGLAQEPPKTGKFESAEAKLAEKSFKARLKAATEVHEKENAAARAQYAKDLDAAMKLATKAANLDEALRIRAAIESIDDERPATATAVAAAASRIPEAAVVYRGHHYLAVLKPNVTWTQARDVCRKMGGDLVVINDKTEFKFVRTLNGATNLYIGARRAGTNWKWVDGTPVGKEFWHEKYPHDNPDFEFVYINGVDSIGNDVESAETIPGFICEWTK